MAELTPNFKLKKPEENEYYDVGVFNENADKIDAALAADSVHANDTTSHITTAIHVKTGTVHNLVVPEGGKNLAFLATASIAAGDTWMVNGQMVTAKLQNNSILPAGLFASGLWVVGVRQSDDGAMLVFNSPGALPNPSSLTVSTGNGGQTGSYNGSSSMSISIPKLMVSSSAPSSTLPAGTIWGVY